MKADHVKPAKQRRSDHGPRRVRWPMRSRLRNVGIFLLGIIAGAGTVLARPLVSRAHLLRNDVSGVRTHYGIPAVTELVQMAEPELSAIDPLAMNVAVLREIPEYKNADTERYSRVVDEWAKRIEQANRLMEADAKRNDPAYAYDPNLWRAGGMAVGLAGSSIGISYTAAPLDAGDPTQTFLPGLIDSKRGTCSNMPILYLAIAHRLGWPMHAVVSGDHMWVRWDDGKPGPQDGGSYFNLEATDAEAEGEIGSFATPTDDDYRQILNTPAIAFDSGSDFRSLTRRELLGVFLQTRAAFWAAHDDWDKAEHDLLLARSVLPQNRDIFMFLHKAMAIRAGSILTENESQEHSRLFLTLSRQARQHAALARTGGP